MKYSTKMFTLTIVILTTIVATLLVSPAGASKGFSVETGDIAFVDVFYLVDKALLTEDRLADRDSFNAQATETITSLNQQLESLQTQLSTMQQTDPNAGNVYQQYQSVNTQLDTVSRQINEGYQSLIARQIAESYKEIYAASNEIGSQEGFTFVFATRSDGELIQTDTITGITQEILARPLMTPPNAVELTELVRLKLGYPEKAPEPAVVPSADPVEAEVPDQTIEESNEPTPVQEVPLNEDE